MCQYLQYLLLLEIWSSVGCFGLKDLLVWYNTKSIYRKTSSNVYYVIKSTKNCWTEAKLRWRNILYTYLNKSGVRPEKNTSKTVTCFFTDKLNWILTKKSKSCTNATEKTEASLKWLRIDEFNASQAHHCGSHMKMPCVCLPKFLHCVEVFFYI